MTHIKAFASAPPTDEEMNEHIHRLEEIGAERIWVSLKLPLLLFLFPAILPLWLIGDPMAAILPLILP